ncbi:MAG TPA: hypothetical protein VJ183_05780 [Chloroflexia bacterium]|nr:hypothetical protein [Chloroflexia bacterium]
MSGSNEVWEYNIIVTSDLSAGSMSRHIDVTKIWNSKYKDGTTDFTSIADAGAKGWEMFSTVHIHDGVKDVIVCFFKRRKVQVSDKS